MEDFGVDDVGVALRSALDGVLPLVTHTLIEAWCLETMCGQNDLSTSATDSFGLGGAKQHGSETPSSVPFVHPDMRKLAASAPGISVESADDVTGIIPDAAAKQQSVEVSRRFRVELVNAIRQPRAERLAFGIVLALYDLDIHDVQITEVTWPGS